MTGVLDLSLPGTAAFAACVSGWLITHGQPTWLALLAGLLCGAVVGLVNGLIALRGFNPIIVTIGTLSVLSGLAAVIAGGYTFPGLPSLEFMGTHRYAGASRHPGAGVHRRRAVPRRHGLPDPYPGRHPADGGGRQRRGGPPLRHPQRPLQGARAS